MACFQKSSSVPGGGSDLLLKFVPQILRIFSKDAAEAATVIRSGNRVFIHTAAAPPDRPSLYAPSLWPYRACGGPARVPDSFQGHLVEAN